MRYWGNIILRRKTVCSFPDRYRPHAGDYRTAAQNVIYDFLAADDHETIAILGAIARDLCSRSITRPLIQMMPKLDAEKAELAVYALADLFDPRCIPLFRQLWRDPNARPGVRCVSLEGLGWLLSHKRRHAALLDELSLAIRDEDPGVVMSAACVLTFVSEPNRFSTLYEPLANHTGTIAEFTRKRLNRLLRP